MAPAPQCYLVHQIWSPSNVIGDKWFSESNASCTGYMGDPSSLAGKI